MSIINILRYTISILCVPDRNRFFEGCGQEGSSGAIHSDVLLLQRRNSGSWLKSSHMRRNGCGLYHWCLKKGRWCRL